MGILEALRLVMDPELGINIVDMGLIYAVDIDEEERIIAIKMTLSSPGCPMGAAIVGSVENCMQHYCSNYKTVIELVWEPAWSYELISAEGKYLLGL
jgi:metal-sulfur cluster biosynthetic enzyme